MTNQPTEIAIVGGGMVGGALALGLDLTFMQLQLDERTEPDAIG